MVDREAIAVALTDWRPRSETPPAQLLWASDGRHVWFIHGTGRPLPPETTDVLWWQPALVPPLPKEGPACAS